jgi:rhodanese-related sulfurtransferase
MNWTTVLVGLAVVAAFFWLRRASQISTTDALEYLKKGALVIDVRTPGEFASGHLANAINLPLDQIEASIPRRVRDKDQVLLLHCQSGMRSGVARKRLRALGYANAFNLGSYARAAQIVNKRFATFG